jgi:hypothetical protein
MQISGLRELQKNSLILFDSVYFIMYPTSTCCRDPTDTERAPAVCPPAWPVEITKLLRANKQGRRCQARTSAAS